MKVRHEETAYEYKHFMYPTYNDMRFNTAHCNKHDDYQSLEKLLYN